jgi:hypothetical protein
MTLATLASARSAPPPPESALAANHAMAPAATAGTTTSATSAGRPMRSGSDGCFTRTGGGDTASDAASSTEYA